MSGDSTTNNYGVYGTKGVAAASNKPGGRTGSVSWTDASGNFYLFGGYGYSRSAYGNLNDLWRYNASSGQWAWISGDSVVNQFGIYGNKGVTSSSNKPGSRGGAMSCKDASGNVYLFGGGSYAGTTTGPLNDLWKYDNITGLWTWIAGDSTANVDAVYGPQYVAADSVKPSGRSNGTMWMDNSGNPWIFGGFAVLHFTKIWFNEVWKYDPSTGYWAWMSGTKGYNMVQNAGPIGVEGSAYYPIGREGCGEWEDASGNLWMYGGYNDPFTDFGYVYGDLWRYNTSTNYWAYMGGDDYYVIGNRGVYGTKGVGSPVNRPGARQRPLTWSDNSGNLWLFGGRSYKFFEIPYHSLNDLWTYNVSAAQWTWVSGDSSINGSGVYGIKEVVSSSNKPGKRNESIGWVDATGKFWLYGGRFDSLYTSYFYNDLWAVDPAPGTIICPGSTSMTSSISGSSYQWQLSTDNGLTYNNLPNNINYSGTGTVTLNISGAQTSWYGYKYRCVVDVHNSLVITLRFSNTWTGAISSSWESPANWSCGTVPDGYTDVIIPAGAVVTINSNISIATLNLNPSASLTVNPPYTLTLLGH